MEDQDRDGIHESFAVYREGVLIQSFYDMAQTGVPDITVSFEAGQPNNAFVLIPPESLRQEASITWERYPAVLEAEFDGATYIPRPLDFFYSPIGFTELWHSGVLFPWLDPLTAPLTRRVLVFYSLTVERPSQEFSGGNEIVELNNGIPVRAREFVGDLMVSETIYVLGRPQFQRVDLDFDGHMETVRYFRQDNRVLELEELLEFSWEIEYSISN